MNHSQDNGLPRPPDHPGFEGSFSGEETEQLSTLQLLDLIRTRLEFMGVPTQDHRLLRERVEEMEEIQDQAREALERLSHSLEKLRSPALRIGTFLEARPDGTASVIVGGSDYICQLDPERIKDPLQPGVRVALNEAFAVTEALDFEMNGPVYKVMEALEDGRLRLGLDSGVVDLVVRRGNQLKDRLLKIGYEVRLDSSQRVALEVVKMGKEASRVLLTVEPTPWEAVGGQEEAVSAIRDAVEMPYLHAALFKTFQHPVPKGFLLHGPPGCGKTLLGRATAYNLRRQLEEKEGVERPEYFLHIKGPEILNMWLGESERQVRDLFQQCREKAAEGHLAFLFIDEAESILGTRNGGRGGHSIVNTLVPMFCTEMDGLEALQNVVVILASNRADLIDPAILRPGRIDRKIRVKRPDEAGVEAIYRIYLGAGIPLEKTSEELASAITKHQFAHTEENRFLEVSFRSGKTEYLYRGDLASGAIIRSIVERAKETAIQRSIEKGDVSPLSLDDLKAAFEREYEENELFPPSDLTEDWLKLTALDPTNVVRLRPFRGRKTPQPSHAI